MHDNDLEVLTPDEAANILNSNTRTMERWRYNGEGPAFVKIGRRVGYRPKDLRAWLEDQTHEQPRKRTHRSN